MSEIRGYGTNFAVDADYLLLSNEGKDNVPSKAELQRRANDVGMRILDEGDY